MNMVISDSPEVLQTLQDAGVIIQTSATAWSADSILSNVIKAQLGKESRFKSNLQVVGENTQVYMCAVARLLLNGSLLAWVVHGEIDDVSMLREGRAQSLLGQPGAVHVHGVALPHASPLWVGIRP